MDVMFRENWLLSYRTVEGIDKILTQMDRRTKTSPKCNLQQKNFKNFII
jgi:acyl carrier protein phosphodiesterase